MKAEQVPRTNTELGDTVNSGGKGPMRDLRRVPRNIEDVLTSNMNRHGD